jgi:carbamoylphosphate synthase small subunit
MLGKIVPAGAEYVVDFVDPNVRNLVAEASRKSVQSFSPVDGGDVDILAVDCGMKDNIIRQLVERRARVKVVPWNHNIAQVA